MARVKKLNLEVKLLDVDYGSADPNEILRTLGLVSFTLTGVVDQEFIEKLATLCQNELRGAIAEEPDRR
jgi:hypothetical protein